MFFLFFSFLKNWRGKKANKEEYVIGTYVARSKIFSDPWQKNVAHPDLEGGENFLQKKDEMNWSGILREVADQQLYRILTNDPMFNMLGKPDEKF